MAESFETPTISFELLSDQVVLLRAKEGVEITGSVSQRDNNEILNHVAGDYGMIIDRQANYSIQPVEVFQVLNAIPQLKAIAIVAHRSTTETAARIDQSMFKGPLKVCASIDEARLWVEAQLDH